MYVIGKDTLFTDFREQFSQTLSEQNENYIHP